MKHIKTINELYKKTYMSAADKLMSKHKKRSEELKKWAKEGGISFPIERIFVHAFDFSNYPDLKKAAYYKQDIFEGSFYITDFKDDLVNNINLICINVEFTSDYGNKLNIEFEFNLGNFEFRMTIDNSKSAHNRNIRRHFIFNNRKDALAFRKFLIEDVADEFGYKDLNLMNLRINDFYVSY